MTDKPNSKNADGVFEPFAIASVRVEFTSMRTTIHARSLLRSRADKIRSSPIGYSDQVRKEISMLMLTSDQKMARFGAGVRSSFAHFSVLLSARSTWAARVT